jgi:prevent-host-death family protein
LELKDMAIWPLQDAKARLSEVIRAAAKEPQHITLRGEEKVVVISSDDYKRLRKAKPDRTLYEIWKSAPKVPEFETPRRKRERMRKVEL